MRVNSGFAKLTVNFRKWFVIGVMDIVTPKLGFEVRQTYKGVARVPRPFTLMLKDRFGDKPLVGCEIGFGLGVNAESLLVELNMERLYCVDIFEGYFQNGKFFDECYRENYGAFSRLLEDKRVVFFKGDSREVLKGMVDGLDFVYVDGNHSFDYVFDDLVNAWNKVKVGGFVGGHDFTHLCPDVSRGVVEFAVGVGVVPSIVFPDFWFRKSVDV